ncbi:saccharopine dehydrogenase family protein [Amycolatopsis palatopharyngis]|uniref:saccharopine dehydrogenase family protein n=1 Tax=Amycolatopsis palatopharyngis TaxID=187982 RepID=UPI000E2453EA|nr:saccharopine dehydrogenase NADP-binding domain-containing protein [Amycolatopsis palatopharyngis]
MPENRTYDLVLFGATGFTGGLTAEYLARRISAEATWALAGRNRAKLEQLRTRLATINPACADLPLLHADIGEPGSLRDVASASRVVITTVGPYSDYGEPLVAACAAAGTDYVDLTGEPEFVDRMYLRHDEAARRSGARIVHACGFDSIPYDLGTLFTVRRLPQGVPITVSSQVRVNAEFSGGTYSSALTAFSRPLAMLRTARERARVEPRIDQRRVRTPLGRLHRDTTTGRWLVPMSSLDPRIVARSARALPRYGPDFTYHQYASVKRLPTVAVAGVGLAGLALLAQIPPARDALAKIRKPGAGPSPERRAKSWFSVRFTGEAGGTTVVTEFAGGDPGYDETARMLAESALCLAFDELPETAGQVTTAVAMGEALLRRLTEAGVSIRVLDGPSDER